MHMSTNDFNERLRRGWRKSIAKTNAIFSSSNAFFSQAGKMIVGAQIHQGKEEEDRSMKPPETRLFSKRSLAMQNGIAFDEDGTPVMNGSVRFSMKGGRSMSRIKSIKRAPPSTSTFNSPFKPLEPGEVIGENAANSFSFARATSNWWAEPQHADDYVAIFIRDAKGLAVKELHHMSSSTYVRIRIQNRGADGVIKTHEASTRTVHHTRNPLFGQLFFFPISLIKPDTIGTISVINPGIIDGFAGEVQSTFEHYLAACDGPMAHVIQWYKLQKKKASDKGITGELCMLMTVVPQRIYQVLQWSESPSTLLDPQILNALLAQFTLRISFERILNIRFMDLVKDDVDDIVNRLQIQVRVGRSVVTLKIQPKDVKYGQQVSDKGKLVSTASFNLSEEISIPLTSSFDVAFNVMTKKRQKDEIGDIRIYVMDGKKDILFKVQVPIWEVGLKRDLINNSSESEACKYQIPWEQGGTEAAVLNSCMIENIDAWMKRMADEALRGSPPPPNPPVPGSAPGEKTSDPSVRRVQVSASSEPDARSSTNPNANGQKIDDDTLRRVPDLTGVAMTRAFARPTPPNKVGKINLHFPSIYTNIRTSTHKGYVYKRLGEPYAFELIEGHPEVQVAMILVPTSITATGQAAKEEENPEDSSDDEEEAKAEEAAPIALPPPLLVIVCEVVIGGGPLSVFDAIFKQDSSFRIKQAAQEGLTDITIGSWEGSGPEKERKVTYVRPISIPLPMAPKKCNVNEIQKIKAKEAGGFVVETKISTDAPKGDTFFVLIQHAACSDGSNTRLRMSFQVEFTKPVGFLKGAIEGGALSSTKKLISAAVDALVAEMVSKLVMASSPRRAARLMQPKVPSAMTIGSDSTPAMIPVMTKAQDQPSVVPQWLKKFSCVWKEGAGDLAVFLFALILVYVLFCISGDLRSLSRSMKTIQETMSKK